MGSNQIITIITVAGTGGILITFCLYHLMIYIGRIKDYSNLCLSLYLLSLFTILLVRRFYLLFPGYDKNFIYFLLPLITYFNGIMTYLFYVSIYKKIKNTIGDKIFKITTIIFSGYILLSYIIFIFFKIYNVFKIYYIFLGIYGLIFIVHLSYQIITNVIKRSNIFTRKEYIVFLGFFIIVSYNIIYSFLLSRIKLYLPFWLSYGIYIFNAICLAYALTDSFNQEHKQLLELTSTLEQKVHDRTLDLQKAKNQIEQKEKQKSIAFTNIFHEIKTPLTLISNYVEKHIKNYGTTEEIKIARDNIDKLKRDILNALDFEKLDRGMVFYDHSQITDISEVVKMNIFMFKELAYRKSIKIKDDIQDHIYTKIDKNSIDRIINNLIDNAIKYTQSNGEINIILKADNKNIELIIKDTGIGISKEEQKNIFKPYYQISHNKSNIQGIGMGLNIVKTIIDKVKGNIKIESKKDKGTTFTIKLKRYSLKEGDRVEFISKNKESTVDIMSIKLKEPEYKKDRHNIFVVEDNIQMLSYLQESLYNKYNFYYAANGKDALEKLKKINEPDIIISDIMMDEMNGYEFYEELLKLDGYRSIPFIFLTAKSGKHHRFKGLQKGAIDYIEKPFDISELLVKINSIIRMTKALEDGRIKGIQNKLSEYIKGIVSNNNKNNKNKDVLLYKYKISSKESEIISLVLEGLEYKEIAYQLKVSLNTIKTHIKHIFNKCQINNKAELINIFI